MNNDYLCAYFGEKMQFDNRGKYVTEKEDNVFTTMIVNICFHPVDDLEIADFGKCS